ncbi:hypothetical protein SEA_FORK_5 [Microbacterium phage Fork]|nr:hypothetical protein SEA_FORK_117 [Microbacterium phage Fork]AXC36342.1 hypothetical protein SEA_FORK_5 [Microbacterium phage Fork]
MLNLIPLPPVTPTYVQVNIGRNVEGKPMTASEWARFKALVQSNLEYATIGRGVVSVHEGRGAWQDEHGNTVSEDSAYFSTFAVVDIPALRTALAKARMLFWQDAIALIVGSELI